MEKLKAHAIIIKLFPLGENRKVEVRGYGKMSVVEIEMEVMEANKE